MKATKPVAGKRYLERIAHTDGEKITRADGVQVIDRSKLASAITDLISDLLETRDNRGNFAIRGRSDLMTIAHDPALLPIVGRCVKLAKQIWQRPGGEPVSFQVILHDVLDMLNSAVLAEMENQVIGSRPVIHSIYCGIKRCYQTLRHEAGNFEHETASERDTLDVRELCHKVSKDVSQQAADMLFDKFCGHRVNELAEMYHCDKKTVFNTLQSTKATIAKYL